MGDADDASLTPRKPKHQKKISDILRRYPVNVASNLGDIPADSHSIEQHKKAIQNELTKAKPRDIVLRPLMKSTYEERRMNILSVTMSVNDFLSDYPALKRPAMVNLICMYTDIMTYM